MATETLEEQLVKHIDEAVAMENMVLRMLDRLIETNEYAELRDGFRLHKQQTEEQIERLRARLEAHDAEPSMVREIGGITSALMKSVVDAVRGEKAARNARDAYATEHLEIASYHLLERVALRAGDEATAEVARQNRSEEEEMARRIDQNWDRVVDIALVEAGVTA